MSLDGIPDGLTTRFAPSLTGYLHLGHILHMLYVWGIARAKNGKVISRIEDHDLSRRRTEYEEAILDNMKWLGFVPDLGITVDNALSPSPFRQSDCSRHYEKALEQLQKKGLVYGCECSRKTILSEQSEGQGELCYTGTCADKGLSLKGNTVRFRVPDETITFQDHALGECKQAPRKQCGDFSLCDRHGQWTYQFCCVCDDICHGVDVVIRGEDILSSTGRQIQLFHALDHPAPNYFHHSLLRDEEGRKLSKRQRSESITELYEAGNTPEDIIGLALFSAVIISEQTPISLQQALDLCQESISNK